MNGPAISRHVEVGLDGLADFAGISPAALEREIELLAGLPVASQKKGPMQLLGLALDVSQLREADEDISEIFICPRPVMDWANVIKVLEEHCPVIAQELCYAWSHEVGPVRLRFGHFAEGSLHHRKYSGQLSSHAALEIRSGAVQFLNATAT